MQLATNAVVEATSESSASYAANFLAGLPGHRKEMNIALRELVMRQPEWSAAVANPVEFAADDSLERLERFAVHGTRGPGTLSIVYELTQHFPDRMRQYRKEIAQYDVFELLLPGAPDDWVTELLTDYRHTENANSAVQLSYIRTDAARDALVTMLKSARRAERRGSSPPCWKAPVCSRTLERHSPIPAAIVGSLALKRYPLMKWVESPRVRCR